jgi:bromodomain-containing factor 1
MLAMPEDEQQQLPTKHFHAGQKVDHSSVSAIDASMEANHLSNPETSEVVDEQANESSNDDQASHNTSNNNEDVVNESTEQQQQTLANNNELDAIFKTEDPQLVKEQLKYCATILKGLKRHRDGTPFLIPVDPVALGIPDYPNIIKNPMDLSTISKKLEGNEYSSASEFAADVRLMLNNCFTFNAADSQVAKMGRNLEKYFNNCLAKMPASMEQANSLSSAASASPRRKSEPVASPMATRPRRETVTTPGVRRGSNSSNVYTPKPPSSASSAKSGKRQAGDITFCRQVLSELTKKTHQNINWAFMQPVDPVALGIPDYFTVIKNPMDLGTIRRKLDSREYLNAEQFEQDVRLVFSNCFLYNAPDTDIVQMAKALESIFEAKWTQRPIRTPVPTSTEAHPQYSHISDDLDDEERILAISQQISALQSELNALLMRKKLGKPRHHATTVAAPVSTAISHAAAAALPPAKPSHHKTAAQIEEELNKPMTFEEKRQLSISVNKLAPEMSVKVLEIIRDSVPDLREDANTGTIELEIESLDTRTLRKLQQYVRECSKKRKSKPTSSSSNNSSNVKKVATGAGSQPVPAPANIPAAEAVPFPVESSDESSDESGDE